MPKKYFIHKKVKKSACPPSPTILLSMHQPTPAAPSPLPSPFETPPPQFLSLPVTPTVHSTPPFLQMHTIRGVDTANPSSHPQSPAPTLSLHPPNSPLAYCTTACHPVLGFHNRTSPQPPSNHSQLRGIFRFPTPTPTLPTLPSSSPHPLPHVVHMETRFRHHFPQPSIEG